MNFTQINAGAINSKPVNMHFGKRHVFKIVGLADVASSLNDLSFKLEIPSPTSTNEDNKVVVAPWFNVASAGVDPELVGASMVEIAIAEGATLSEVHGALKAALELRNDIKLCYIENGALFVEVKFFGESIGATDVDSLFTFSEEVKGYGGFLGGTEGGATVTPEISTEEVTTDQTGTNPIAEIINSTKFTVGTTIKELSPKRMELLFGNIVGEVFTPDSGSKIIGLGTSKVGSNSSLYTGELILQPVSVDKDDYSQNIHFFNCAILPSSINYGAEQLKTEVTFNVYVDSSKDKRANLGCFGDGFQDLRPL